MNVCMFSRIMPTHSPGGMQDHVQALATGLVKRGHRVTVITSGLDGGPDLADLEGVQVHYLRGTPAGRNTNAYWFRAADKLREIEPDQHFDILHSQSSGGYGVYRRGLHRLYHLPLVTSLHGTHADVFTTSWHTDVELSNPLGVARFIALSLNLLFRYWYRDLWLIRGSDVVIATSDADTWKYKRLYLLDDSHIRKVYNGIDTELFAPRDPGSLRNDLRIPPGDKTILALARLEKDKGVQNAISALPLIRSSIPSTLVIVGDGIYRSALESQSKALGMSDHIRFVGALSLAECARHFNACDLFVDPTLRTDGYDLTIAEALACAKPVVVSDVGANSTLIDFDQADGILIPRGDNSALVRESVRLLQNAELARQMGAKGRAKMVARFSTAAMVEGMEGVYRELVDRFNECR